MVSLKSLSRTSPATPRLATGELRVELFDNLEGLQADWQELYAQIVTPSLCASFDWATAWWDVFGKNCAGARPYIVLLRDEALRPIALFPFFEQNASIRRLRLMGDLGQDSDFGMTEEPIQLVVAGWESRALAALAAVLQPGIRTGRWDLISFRTLDAATSCPLAAAFKELKRQSWIKTDVRSGCDIATLPDSWADYRKKLTKSMRDNLGYYPRLLTRDGHQWQVRYIRDVADIPAAVTRLSKLHQARAESHRGQRHCNHIHGPAQEAFLTRLLGALTASDHGFIAELVVNGEIVASQAFVEQGEELMVYYSGYQEAWYKYSPIFVIDAVVFQDAMARGARRLNFLRNTGQWKTRWGAESGPRLRRASLVPRRPMSALRYGLYFAQSAIRRHVIQRLPVYRHRLVAKVKVLPQRVAQERERLIQVLFPLLPILGRIGLRATPTLHWVVMHHR